MSRPTAEKSNNEKFCDYINSLEHPRLVLEALKALAPIIREARTQQQREALIAAMKGCVEG